MALSRKIFNHCVWVLVVLSVLFLLLPEGVCVEKVSLGFIETSTNDQRIYFRIMFGFAWVAILVLRTYKQKYSNGDWVVPVVIYGSVLIMLFRYEYIVKGTEYVTVNRWWHVGFCCVGMFVGAAISLLVFGLYLLLKDRRRLREIEMLSVPYVARQLLLAAIPLSLISLGVGVSLICFYLYLYEASLMLPIVLMVTWCASDIMQEVLNLSSNKKLQHKLESLRSISNMMDYFVYPYYLSVKGGRKNKTTNWKLSKSIVANGFGNVSQVETAKRLRKQAEGLCVDGSVTTYEEVRQFRKDIYRVEWRFTNGNFEEFYIRKEEVSKYLEEYKKLCQSDNDFATRNKHPLAIQVALAYVIQNKILKQRGTSLLEWRLALQDMTDLEVLISLDPGINQPLFQGWTLLLYATVVGFVEGVRLLLKYGADIEKCNMLSRSPLYYAVLYGNIETVVILLNAGAKVDVKDGQDVTPLMVAAQYKRKEIVSILLQHGADMYAKNLSGETALDVAIKSRAGEIATILRKWENSHIGKQLGGVP